MKPKRQRLSNTAEGIETPISSSSQVSDNCESDADKVQGKEVSSPRLTEASDETKLDNPVKSSLVAYESSDDDE